VIYGVRVLRTGGEPILIDRLTVLARGATTIGAAAVLIGCFGPWLRSGETNRSSFELLSLVERLGFAEDGLFGWAVRLWPLVPLLVVASVVAVWLDRPVVAATFTVIAAVYVGGVVLGVSQARDSALISTGWGVVVSGAGAVILAAAGIAMGATSRARYRG
jgi:hypothetical protein